MATLLYHWPLNEGAGTNCAALVGSDPLTISVVSGYPQWVDGAVAGSKALKFSGSNSSWPDRCVLEVEDRTVGCPIDGGASLTAWIRTTANANNLTRTIFGAQATNPATNPTAFTVAGMQLIYYGTGDTLRVGVDLGKIFSRYNRYATASSAINDDAWHFVVGTMDKATLIVKAYVDAVLEGSYDGLAEDPLFYWNNNFSPTGMGIAVGSGNAAYYDTWGMGSLDGSVDDPRVYCGVLTQDEIDALYEAGPYANAVANALMFSCNT